MRFDVNTAFQLLDMIQGHPGYARTCYVCGLPLTDWFGVIPTPEVGSEVGMAGDRDGVRHDYNGWCPYFPVVAP